MIANLIAFMHSHNAALTVKLVDSSGPVWRAQLDWQAFGLVVKLGDTADEALDSLNSWAAKQ